MKCNNNGLLFVIIYASDVIKGNESDVGKIDCELKAKIGNNDYLLYCFVLQIYHSLHQISDWNGIFDQNVAVKMGKWPKFKKKNENWILPTSDSFFISFSI